MPRPRSHGVPLLTVALATTALVLVAAKAHGRQVRLEREQQGYFRVDFRSQNPAAVEAIWRSDRRILWPAAVALFACALPVAFLVGHAALAALAIPWAFTGAFTIAGLASWVRLARRDQGPLPWRRRAFAGSLAWWGLAAAATLLLAWSVEGWLSPGHSVP